MLMLDKVIEKIKLMIGKQQGKAVMNSYMLKSRYPITFIINKIQDYEEKHRIINLIYKLLQMYNINAQVHIIDGEEFGDPMKQMIIFVVSFKYFDKFNNRWIDLPDREVIMRANNLAQTTLSMILHDVGVKNFTYVRGFPPFSVMRKIGFSGIDLAEITRKNMHVYKYDIQEVARLLGINPQPRPVQVPQSPGGYSANPTGYNYGVPQPGIPGQQTPVNQPGMGSNGMNNSMTPQVPQNNPIADLTGDLDINLSGEDIEVEESVFDTGSIIEKLKDVWENNDFDYKLARKYQILNYIMRSEEYLDVFNKTIKAYDGKKPLWVFNIGYTYDGTQIYFPFIMGMNNHMAIFGVAGSGKSYGASVLLEEAILRGIPVVIVANNTEWDVMKELPEKVTPEEAEKIYNNPGFHDNIKIQLIIPKSLEDEVDNYDDTFQISIEDISLDDFRMIMSLVSSGGKDLGALQESVIVKFFDMVEPEIEVINGKKVKKIFKFKDRDGNERPIKTFEDMYEFFLSYTDDELAEMFHLDKKRASSTLTGIRNRLYMLKRNKYTNKAIGDKKLPIEKIDKPNTVTIIKMPSVSSASDLATIGISMIMLFRIMKEINKFRGYLYEKYDQVPPYPIILFIDEAHNYFSSKLESILGKELAKRFIDQVVTAYKEQRKFGVSYFITTQNPGDIHPDLLAQIINIWVGKINKSDASLLQNLFNIDQQLVRYFLEMSQKYHEFFFFSSVLESTNKPILMKWKESRVKK